jgi:hypothetical protein
MISPYAADDSDDFDERNNYWRNWEAAERLASATTCDFYYHCFECHLACGDDTQIDIAPCEQSTPLHLSILTTYHHTQKYKTFWVHKGKGNIEMWWTKRW